MHIGDAYWSYWAPNNFRKARELRGLNNESRRGKYNDKTEFVCKPDRENIHYMTNNDDRLPLNYIGLDILECQ